LEYAPTPMIKKLKCELERIRTFTDELWVCVENYF
jgi:hypothetical protein